MNVGGTYLTRPCIPRYCIDYIAFNCVLNNLELYKTNSIHITTI